jgi:hypothetical protein
MRLFLAILLFYSVFSSKAQNLVLNPSFEDTISTNYTVHYPICQNWFNANGMTVDYFSPYCQELLWGNGFCSPQTVLGFRQAHTGVAFIGLVIWEPNNHVTKEYAQGFLSQPLVQGGKYYVSMYINMADSSNYKTCEIEIAFTDTLIYSNQGGSFNFTDTVKFNISNVDTTNWYYVTGKYTAHGGETYIYIGSNTPNANLACIDSLPGYLTQAAYYFIDNIYVSQNPLLITNLNKSIINVFPNPADKILNINNLLKNCNYSIYNITGLLIKNGRLSRTNNEINVSIIPNGIYFLALNENEFYKIIINH